MKNFIQSSVKFLAFIILINSCKTDDKELIPAVPLPANPCSSSFAYGYCDQQSYYPGDIIKVYIQSKNDIPSCALNIYKITGELVFSVNSPLTIQKITEKEPSMDGYGFQPTVEITVPSDLKSGIYLIEKALPFIVKTRKPVDAIVVYPFNTANAYCTNGGKGLYTKPDKPSYVSFLRPIPIQKNAEVGLRWFSQLEDFEIGFVSDSDLDDYESIRNGKMIIITGHSEYWTRKGRENFDRFVNQGGDAIILSGNTMWWQVRYSENKDRMIHYLYPNEDPEQNPLMKTINWDQSSLQFPIINSIGADFPRGGYGLQNDVGWDGFKITNPASPLLEGTGLKKGDILKLPSGEYDGAAIKYFDSNNFPVLDLDACHFNKIELIGFDRGSRFSKETIGTFIVLKRSENSGIIVNGASYDWCSSSGMGGVHGDNIKKITHNAIFKLLHHQQVFTN